MAITYTDILGLRLSTDFDDSLNFNFRKLDTLGSVFDETSDGKVVIRSTSDIVFEPNSTDLGGDGAGSIDYGSSAVTGMTIDASTSTITGLTDSSIDDAAAIAGSKITPAFTDYVSSTLGLRISSTYNTTIQPADAGQTEDLTFKLPSGYGNDGQVLQSDGLGGMEWASVGGIIPPIVYTWTQAAADTQVINHALGTTQIDIIIYDENGATIDVDSALRTDSDNVTLTRIGTPTGDWTVLINPIFT